MKRQNTFGINFWIPFVFFAMLFAFLVTEMYYHFFFIEQESFFAQTPEFLNRYFLKPGGLTAYCSQYLVQFYQTPWAGALIVVCLSVILFSLTRRTILKYNPEIRTIATFLSLIPNILLIFVFCSPFYQLTEYLALIAVLSGCLIYTLPKKQSWRLLLAIVFGLSLYLLTGAFFYIFITTAIAFEIKNQNLKKPVNILILLIIAFAFPYICRFTFFYMLNIQAYLASLPYSPDRLQLSFARVLADWIIFIVLLFYILLPFILLTCKNYKKMPVWVSLCAFILIMGASAFCIKKWGYSKDQIIFEKVNYLVESEKWDETWTICRDYFIGGTEANGYYPYSLHEYTKLSALMSRNFPEEYCKLLHHPGFSIFFYQAPESYSQRYNFWSDFYYNVGLFTYARQNALCVAEIQSMQNKSLRKIVQCNLVINDTKFNIKYANLLAKTPNYKNYIADFKKDTSYLSEKRKLIATKGFWDTYIPDMTMLTFADISPQNPYAFEYACMFYLLYLKEEGYLIDYLHRFKELGYEHIPTFFEEALITASGYGMEPDIQLDDLRKFDFGGYHLREETLLRCQNFFDRINRINQGFGSLASIENDFNDTYYFHKYFRLVDLDFITNQR